MQGGPARRVPSVRHICQQPSRGQSAAQTGEAGRRALPARAPPDEPRADDARGGDPLIAQEQARWQPLGTGRIAPQGSIADRALAAHLAGYKRQVAGRYRSISPADLATALPPGPYIVSPKLDGETWFVRVAGGEAWLLSPTGRAIADVPATEEAGRLFAGADVPMIWRAFTSAHPFGFLSRTLFLCMT